VRHSRLNNIPGFHACNFQGVCLAPAPQFSMSVREAYRAGVPVARCRETDPGPHLSAEDLKAIRGIDAEGTLLNAGLVFVDERERFICSGYADVTESMPALVKIRICSIRPAIHIASQGHATRTRRLAEIADRRFICGTLVNAN